jgi:glutamate mutase epsilon subunit
VRDKEGIPPGLHQLKSRLDDRQTLSHYDIQPGSTLDLEDKNDHKHYSENIKTLEQQNKALENSLTQEQAKVTEMQTIIETLQEEKLTVEVRLNYNV